MTRLARVIQAPTAPVWNEEFGPERFRDKIVETNRGMTPHLYHYIFTSHSVIPSASIAAVIPSLRRKGACR